LKTRITTAALAACLAIVAGCGGDKAEQGPVASCDYASPGEVKVGGGRVARHLVRVGNFGLLRGPGTFRAARPVGAILDPQYKDRLIITIAATVLGTDPVTVSVPPEDRGEVGLLYGSSRGYTEPLASVDFEPCPGQNGTSWPGGLVVADRGPVTLLVEEDGSDDVRRLVLR
jgi:hypothetical protein